MPRPANYILNTDYATLANDSSTVAITVSIPGDAIAGGGTIQTYTGSGAVGMAGSPIEYDISSSMSDTRWKGLSGYYCLFVENEGGATQYQYLVFVYKSSASTVTVNVYVFNGSGSSITKNARTITVRVRSFVPPFA